MSERKVKGFAVRLDLAYDLTSHMWVDVLSPDRVRVGMDSLGLETSGTLAQMSFVDPGNEVARSGPFGSLEAEKFVGALVAPLTGRVVAVNDEVLGDPGLVERDPYGAGWLVEMVPAALDSELAELVSGEDAIVAAFERKVIDYKIQGVLAE